MIYKRRTVTNLENLLGIENKARKDHNSHKKHHHIENELANAILERKQEHTKATVLGHEREDPQDAENVKDLDVVVNTSAPRVLVGERLGRPKERHDGQELEEVVGVFDEASLVRRRQEAQHVLDGEEDVANELDCC